MAVGFAMVCFVLIGLAGMADAQSQPEVKIEDVIAESLRQHQYDLGSQGKAFLLTEARNASFFLLGELHGENEIPALLRELWPQMRQDGYRYIAAELSPWAAHQLEFAPEDRQPELLTLWTKPEAHFVHVPGSSQATLWGCDMEEIQPQLLIQELAEANPSNSSLARMVELTKSGYRRKMAPELLELLRGIESAQSPIHDEQVDDLSLLKNLKATLEIEAARFDPKTKLVAQVRRESLMKDSFLVHYEKNIPRGSNAKVMLRFGRNHLHRGYDDRGISTLGNFVAEFAFSRQATAFNLAAFGAGGKASLNGETWDADEREDDLAFAFLASLARHEATVFDLRPLRAILHQIPEESRTPLQLRLIYWSNSYDAILCYKNVTPRTDSAAH